MSGSRPFSSSILKPGDCLLYSPSDFFDRIVALKTWANVSHVEVFAGWGKSVASRNGKGVGKYDLRTDHVAAVLRPGPEFNFAKAMVYFGSVDGEKYGWRILLTFTMLNQSQRKGEQICSEFASNFYLHGDYPLFSAIYPSYRVAPATLLTTRRLQPVWDDGVLFKDL